MDQQNPIKSPASDVVKARALLNRAVRSALAFSVCTVLCVGCTIEILHDLEEPQANTVLATLQKSGISAKKTRVAQGSTSTYMVEVSKSDAPKAWRVLREHNLPRRKAQGLGEVFGKSTLVPTAAQQRALMRHALSGEITRTLESIDGVSAARVHIVLPRRDPLAPPDKAPPQPRASVLLKVRAGATVTEGEVKRLVSGGLATMSPDAVQVVIARTRGATTVDKSTKSRAVGFSSVGPFQVSLDSRTGLIITLVVAVLVILGLGLFCLVLWMRLRQAARQQEHTENVRSPDLDASLSLIGQSVHTRSSHYTRK